MKGSSVFTAKYSTKCFKCTQQIKAGYDRIINAWEEYPNWKSPEPLPKQHFVHEHCAQQHFQLPLGTGTEWVIL